jgi:NADH pyrophosphatase NudC (nudix superfamily)
MRGTTGDKLIKYIKNTNPEIICLLSSCDLIKLEDFIENKVDGVIHTPINELKLSQILNKVLLKCGKGETKTNTHEVKKVLNDKNNCDDSIEILSTTSINNKSVSFSFCPYCGQKLDVSYKEFLFCPYCGQKVGK